jgi:hypothetical protein
VTLEPTQKPLKIGGPVNSKYHLPSILSAYPTIPNAFLLKLDEKEWGRKARRKVRIKKNDGGRCEIYWRDPSNVETGRRTSFLR